MWIAESKKRRKFFGFELQIPKSAFPACGRQAKSEILGRYS